MDGKIILLIDGCTGSTSINFGWQTWFLVNLTYNIEVVNCKMNVFPTTENTESVSLFITVIICTTVAPYSCKRFLPSFLLEGGGSGWPKEVPGNSAIALTRMEVRYKTSASWSPPQITVLNLVASLLLFFCQSSKLGLFINDIIHTTWTNESSCPASLLFRPLQGKLGEAGELRIFWPLVSNIQRCKHLPSIKNIIE